MAAELQFKSVILQIFSLEELYTTKMVCSLPCPVEVKQIGYANAWPEAKELIANIQEERSNMNKSSVQRGFTEQAAVKN